MKISNKHRKTALENKNIFVKITKNMSISSYILLIYASNNKTKIEKSIEQVTNNQQLKQTTTSYLAL